MTKIEMETQVDADVFSQKAVVEVCSNHIAAGKNGLMRLQFNKIGYEIYDKEQSRRVPAVRAKVCES